MLNDHQSITHRRTYSFVVDRSFTASVYLRLAGSFVLIDLCFAAGVWKLLAVRTSVPLLGTLLLILVASGAVCVNIVLVMLARRFFWENVRKVNLQPQLMFQNWKGDWYCVDGETEYSKNANRLTVTFASGAELVINRRSFPEQQFSTIERLLADAAMTRSPKEISRERLTNGRNEDNESEDVADQKDTE